MLHLIRNLSDSFLSCVKDDPVRPEISAEFRVSSGRLIAALTNAESPNGVSAMVCISFHDSVPEDVAGLDTTVESPSTAVFYTIWSYKPGAGTELLRQTVTTLQKEFPSLNRFVTLSPKTPVAKRFHLKNGAIIFRENVETINYEYKVI